MSINCHCTNNDINSKYIEKLQNINYYKDKIEKEIKK